MSGSRQIPGLDALILGPLGSEATLEKHDLGQRALPERPWEFLEQVAQILRPLAPSKRDVRDKLPACFWLAKRLRRRHDSLLQRAQRLRLQVGPDNAGMARVLEHPKVPNCAVHGLGVFHRGPNGGTDGFPVARFLHVAKKPQRHVLRALRNRPHAIQPLQRISYRTQDIRAGDRQANKQAHARSLSPGALEVRVDTSGHPNPLRRRQASSSRARMSDPMRALSVLSVLLALMLLPSTLAQVPGIKDAITDGTAFEYDDEASVERIRAVADSISGNGVHDCVQMVTSDPTTAYRMMGTPTQDAFIQKHRNTFADFGLASDLHHFQNGSAAFGVGGTVFGEGGTNLLAVLPGTHLDKWVVIGGHYDTREATIGALDNGSGLCSVYEVARAMKADVDANGPYEASIVFAWYDGEEWGLYGAVAFSQDTKVAKRLLGLPEDASVEILVSQSFDMPGLNYPARNIWVQYGEPVDLEGYAVLNLRTAPIHDENDWTCWSYGCYEDLKTRTDFETVLHANTNYQFLVREVAYDLLQYPPEYVWISDDHYGRSDHIPLIAAGAAGMRIQGSHDEEYPCYHQPCDTLEWLYLQAGSRDELLLAYNTEATIGGTVAMYAALRGEVGPYGEPFWAAKRGANLADLLALHPYVTAPGTLQDDTPPTDAEIPAPAAPASLAAVCLAALMQARRITGRIG